MNAAHIVRSKELLAPPVKLDQAFDDGQAVLDLIDKGSPYKTEACVHHRPGEAMTGGWFRNFWALGGKVVFDGAEPLFHNARFIEAAQQSFEAEIIRPVAMMTNLNLPAAGLPSHLDLPFFRGAANREVPSWMLAPMGYSGLFHDWAIPVASAITWFYDGTGGAFEYWPQGLGAPAKSVRPPYSNMCVIADNEYMYHRVGPTGAPAAHWANDSIPYEATLELTDGHDWRLSHGNAVLADFAYDKIRLSVLWKAFCFKDAATAAAFDDHSNDLTPDLVREIFCTDLRRRNIAFAEPGEPTADLAWKDTLTTAYAAPCVSL